MVWIQNQPVIAGSKKICKKVNNGGATSASGVLAELGNLVSCVVHADSCALLKKVELSNNAVLVERMLKGRH